jgi:hypothetical protein
MRICQASTQKHQYQINSQSTPQEERTHTTCVATRHLTKLQYEPNHTSLVDAILTGTTQGYKIVVKYTISAQHTQG